MRTAAILPVKSFDRAKTRLDHAPRAELAAGMAADVLSALSDARALDAVFVVSREAAARHAASEHGFTVVDEPTLLGHSGAAELGIARAVAAGMERVLLIPGDCPLLGPADVDALLARHPGPGVVVVPDRHGTGTNALLLAPPAAIRPAFGPGSRERHTALAREAGVPVTIDEVPSLLLDVDTAEDLEAVRAALPDLGDAAATRRVLGAPA